MATSKLAKPGLRQIQILDKELGSYRVKAPRSYLQLRGTSGCRLARIPESLVTLRAGPS
jgi:hypothetical protein